MNSSATPCSETACNDVQPENRHSSWHWYGFLVFNILCFAVWFYISQRLNREPKLLNLTRVDATLDVWRHAALSKHWFLFFLNAEDAANGVPYGNMPYLLGIFYEIYHTVLNVITFGRWPLYTTYLMSLVAIFWASWFALKPYLRSVDAPRVLLILFLTSGILLTSPYLTAYMWVNHDQFYAMSGACSIVLALAIWRGKESTRDPIVWAALIFACISHMVGLVSLACCFLARRRFALTTRTWIVLFSVSIINFLLPMLLAKLAFGHSSASGIGFRTGLDGSIQLFSSHWQAIVRPVAIRSIVRELAMPLLVGGILVAVGWRYAKDCYGTLARAVGVACLPYAFHWAIFPQAISVHPYLYDLLFLIPFNVGLALLLVYILIGAKELTHGFSAAIAVGATALLLQDNLLQLAQGKIIGYDY